MSITVQSGVYRINLGHGRFYIGSSKNLARRKLDHLQGLLRHRHFNPIMQATFNKYGVFKFVVLESCPIDQILLKEQALLDVHFGTKGCTNLCPIAGNLTGHRHTQATRNKMAEAYQRSPQAVAARKKWSEVPLETLQELDRLEEQIVRGLELYSSRNELIAELVAGGESQIDITRQLNKIRAGYGAPELTPNAIGATIRRQKSSRNKPTRLKSAIVGSTQQRKTS